MTYRVSNWTILNDKDERLFSVSHDGALHCTALGLERLCELLNSGGQFSEQGDTPTCSFCGKTNEDVKFLFANASAAICDQCLAVCNRAMAEQSAREEPADQGPTLGEEFAQWEGKWGAGEPDQFVRLLARIVEAIGRDKR